MSDISDILQVKHKTSNVKTNELNNNYGQFTSSTSDFLEISCNIKWFYAYLSFSTLSSVLTPSVFINNS